MLGRVEALSLTACDDVPQRTATARSKDVLYTSICALPFLLYTLIVGVEQCGLNVSGFIPKPTHRQRPVPDLIRFSPRKLSIDRHLGLIIPEG